jgi:hypothetical protein
MIGGKQIHASAPVRDVGEGSSGWSARRIEIESQVLHEIIGEPVVRQEWSRARANSK